MMTLFSADAFLFFLLWSLLMTTNIVVQGQNCNDGSGFALNSNLIALKTRVDSKLYKQYFITPIFGITVSYSMAINRIVRKLVIARFLGTTC